MTEKIKNRDYTSLLLVLATVFLINPVVRVVDILPDFIACFIISKYLTYAADRVPYFEEAKQAFIKLGFVSLAKIPAFFIISYAHSVNVSDYDTSVLFTFAFSVIEIVLFYFAIKNLFSGLFYLGERSNCTKSILGQFKFSKSGRSMTPEMLEIFCFVYAFLRCALTALPEMLLLSRTSDGGAHLPYYNPARLYPYTIILTVIGTLVLAVLFAKRVIAYIRAVSDEGCFTAACDSLVAPGRESEITKRRTSKELCFGLTLLTIAPVLTLDLCFDNFNDVNLLPHFLFGGFVILALFSMRRVAKIERGAYISLIVFCIIAIITYGLEINFLDTYGYEALVDDNIAKSAYSPVIIAAAAEFVAQAAVAFFVSNFLIGLAKEHICTSHADNQASKARRNFEKKMKIKIYLLGGFMTLSGISKFADTLQRYFSDLTLVATNDGIGNIVSGLIPWFGMIVFICTAIYIGYSMYLFSLMRTEIEIKYA